MKKYGRHIAVALLSSVSLKTLTATPASAVAAESAIVDQINIPFETFKLDNGLTVIVHTDKTVPTVFVGMWYLVGSKDEPEGKTGFAHLFEHLMFQETENRKGEYFTPFIKAGATGMNGTTNTDRTNYFATVPTAALDMALWMESDRMIHLLGAVDQAALDSQREVVKNEKRQRENQAYAKMFPQLIKSFFPAGHPYGHDVIGSMEDLDKASVEDVHEWFNTYYGASNAFLVLSGDVDTETAKEKVAKYFGAVPAGGPLAKQERWIPELGANKTDFMYDKVPQTRISRNWALPPADEKDTVLMELVNDTLVSNENAPLRKKLVDELNLATDISGSVYDGVINSMYNLTVNLKPGVDPKEVSRVIDETIAEYLEAAPEQALLEASKLSANMRTITYLESKAYVGFILAQGNLFAGDPNFYKTELEWMNGATRANVLSIADEWLSKPYYELTVSPFPDYASEDTDVDRSTAPEVEKGAGSVSFPKINTATLENGVKLVVAKYGALPLVNIRFEFPTGDNADLDGKLGAGALAFQLLDDGTKKYSADQLSSAMDKVAMKPNVHVDYAVSTISYPILSPNFDDSISLVAEMLQNPSFLEEELKKLKEEWLVYLDGRETNPAGSASAYFRRAIYGAENPLGRILTKEKFESLTRDDLIEFFEREAAPEQLTVYMIGDIDISEAKAALDKTIGKWRKKGASKLNPVGDALKSAPRVILVDQPDAVQSTIFAGHALPPFKAESETALDLMNDIFGGVFDARVNMNLREDKGWSYGMYSAIENNTSGDRFIVVRGSVQTDRTKDSMVEILKEYRDLHSNRPATADEMNRIVLNQTRALPGRFSTSGDFLRSIARSAEYGLPLNYDEGAAPRIEAMSLDEIQGMALTLIDPDNLSWVVVGDLSKIENDIRALNYGEVEVWDTNGERLR